MLFIVQYNYLVSVLVRKCPVLDFNFVQIDIIIIH